MEKVYYVSEHSFREWIILDRIKDYLIVDFNSIIESVHKNEINSWFSSYCTKDKLEEKIKFIRRILENKIKNLWKNEKFTDV